MPGTASFDEGIFQQLLGSALSAKEMEDRLNAEGVDAQTIAEFLKKVKQHRLAKRQSTGFMYMAAGALTGFLSCVFAIGNVFPDFSGFILYGLTSIAVLLVMAGLYLVFE